GTFSMAWGTRKFTPLAEGHRMPIQTVVIQVQGGKKVPIYPAAVAAKADGKYVAVPPYAWEKKGRAAPTDESSSAAGTAPARGGGAHEDLRGSLRGQRVLVRDRAGEHRRPHRPQRIGQEHGLQPRHEAPPARRRRRFLRRRPHRRAQDPRDRAAGHRTH